MLFALTGHGNHRHLVQSHGDQGPRFSGRRRLPAVELQRPQFGRRASGQGGAGPPQPGVGGGQRRWPPMGAAQCRPRFAPADQRYAGASSRPERGPAQQPDQGGGADQWRCRCDRRPAVSARRPAFHHLRHARACSTCSPPTACSTCSMPRLVKRVVDGLWPAFAVEGPARPRGHRPSSPSRCRARCRFISRTRRPGPVSARRRAIPPA